MKFETPGIYHIYNRGNFKQPIFYSNENYFYFLRKCQLYLKPVCEILAWCLMTNHFHFGAEITEKSLQSVRTGTVLMPAISNGFRLLQSSYAKGLNKQLNRTGNLFQQKTKSKFIYDTDEYPLDTFLYIHQNPVAAGIVKYAEEWPYSSWQDYLGLRNGNLCNIPRAKELLSLDSVDLRFEMERRLEKDWGKIIL